MKVICIDDSFQEDFLKHGLSYDVVRDDGDYYQIDVEGSPVPFKKNRFKEFKEDKHYNNSNGSLYKFAQDHELNAWEFDIIKRITRCRKKGQFKDDLEKTKRVIELYLKEYKSETNN